MESNDKMQEVAKDIVGWIKNYAESCNKSSLVIGISGGVDSSVVSTLCANTGLDVVVVSMPIHQLEGQDVLSKLHANKLLEKYDNVAFRDLDLSKVFDSFVECLKDGEKSQLSLANTRSRIRMTALYQIASTCNGLVVGTGNKVEDFGIGFYTKYGDGGVDISPIANLYKTEVWDLAKYLDVSKEIIDAPPTDGLWDDGRTDEDQIGASYQELEHVMKYGLSSEPTDRQREVFKIYTKHNLQNSHKMLPIPVFSASKDNKGK